MECPPLDPPFAELDPEFTTVASTLYTWPIPELPKDASKIALPVFKCGDHEFEILLFPRYSGSSSQLAAYLALKNECCAQFALVLHDGPKIVVQSRLHHRFTPQEADWGFGSFAALLELATLLAPCITCHVRVVHDATGVLWHTFVGYDLRAATGCVGIRNQGATCYLNLLLQLYFFTPVFRKLVFQIPPEDDAVARALQRLFYLLLTDSSATDTAELTRSFGWDATDSFTQHDVQELNRVLMDRLETAMKGTPAESVLLKTFVGRMKLYIKCVDVEYESARVEDFWDIQLNVKGLKGLADSFKDYIATETLDGENKYDAEKFGLQVAQKGVVFQSLPNVLHLQLKRFDYDFEADFMVKVNDRYEFPESIDLAPYVESSQEEDWTYDLYAVLIHSGDITLGHYYAVIKPGENEPWLRFDDDRVTKVTRSEVFEANFGCNRLAADVVRQMLRQQYAEYQLRRQTLAYMLVYFRRARLPEVLTPFDAQKDVPPQIVESVRAEQAQAAARRKEREDAHLYVRTSVYLGDKFRRYQGFDLGRNRTYAQRWNQTLYDAPGEALVSAPPSLDAPPDVNRRLRSMPVGQFCEELLLQTPLYSRLWLMAHRRNETTRPDTPIGLSDASFEPKAGLQAGSLPQEAPLEAVIQKLVLNKHHGLFVWLEDAREDILHLYQAFGRPSEFSLIPRNFLGIQRLMDGYKELIGPENLEFSPPELAKTDILVLLKYFDLANQTLTGIGHAIVPKTSKVLSLLPALGAFLGVPENQVSDINLYEEVKPTLVELVATSKTFAENELQNGDILVALVEKISSLANRDVYAKAADLAQKPLGDIPWPQVLEHRDKLVDNVLVKCSTVQEFYRYLQTRVHITIGPVGENPEYEFWVGLNTLYMEIAEAVSQRNGVDATKIRLFVMPTPHGQGIPLGSGDRISRVIGTKFNNNKTVQFTYEVLSMPVAELELMRTVKVGYFSQGVLHVQSHEFLVSADAKIEDVISQLSDKVGGLGELLDLWSVQSQRIVKTYNLDEPVETIPHKSVLYVRPLAPEEEYPEFSEGGRGGKRGGKYVIQVVQFFKEPLHSHGVPFHFVLKEGETLEETQKRLQQKLALGDKEFSKMAIGLLDLTSGAKRYFERGILYDEATVGDVLFLDGPDRSRHGGYGGAIKIN